VHSKRLTIRSVLSVHNYSATFPHPRPELGILQNGSCYPDSIHALCVHLSVQGSKALVVKHRQSGMRKEATVFCMYMIHKLYIPLPDHSLLVQHNQT